MTMKVEGLVSGTSSSEHLASGTSSSAQSVNDMRVDIDTVHQVGENSAPGPSSSLQTIYKTTDSGETTSVLASGDETRNAIDSIAMIHFAHMQSAFSL